MLALIFSQTMKYILTSLTILFLTSCSTSVEGLWIESDGNALLKFYKDSVINNSLQTTIFRDTLGFQITKDSIKWTGLNPEWNNGKTEKSFKYILNGDSLQIWFKPNERYIYLKSQADNFQKYFLTKGDLKLQLPTADNVKPTLKRYEPLNIRIGYKDEKIKVFVEENETSIYDLDKAIKKFKTQKNVSEFWSPDIICQLFMDENVNCEYTFWVFDHLRTNNIRRINFITESDNYDPYTQDFWGLAITIPPSKLSIVEEKNER